MNQRPKKKFYAKSGMEVVDWPKSTSQTKAWSSAALQSAPSPRPMCLAESDLLASFVIYCMEPVGNWKHIPSKIGTQTAVFFSHSQAMDGWRLGWAICPDVFSASAVAKTRCRAVSASLSESKASGLRL